MSDLLEEAGGKTLEEFEQAQPTMPDAQRWELIDGWFIKAALGAPWEHNVISQNIACGFRQQLRTRNARCHVFRETFYMKNRSIETAALPDAMISRELLAPGATCVDDPVILVEVMSRESAGRDRNEKWRAYRRLPSLQHYVLVDQHSARVGVFDREAEGWASERSLEGLDAVLALPALGVSLSLAEIYEDVFPA